jgi:hypothetical protein
MYRKPCMSEYFCHGVICLAKIDGLSFERKCSCSEKDVLTYSAERGLPLFPISKDEPLLLYNTWQGFFHRRRRPLEEMENIFKAYYDVTRNCWFCYGLLDDEYHEDNNSGNPCYFTLEEVSKYGISCSVLDNLSEYKPIKAKMTLNPLLNYLPRFTNQQKINTQKRLTDFILKEIASDIIKNLFS